MGKTYKQERPAWCPNQSCGFSRRVLDGLCGGKLPEPMAHGGDYIKGALMLALGEPLEKAMPHFVPRWHLHSCCWAKLGPPEGGVISHLKGGERAEKLGTVHLRFDVGDTIPPLVDCGARVAFCIAEGEGPREAFFKARSMTELIELTVE